MPFVFGEINVVLGTKKRQLGFSNDRMFSNILARTLAASPGC